MQCFVFLLVILSRDFTDALCPDNAGNLNGITKTFTEVINEQGGLQININEGVIMDQSPPDIYMINIQNNGKLVWKPTNIMLKVYNITVHGQMYIGGADCRFTNDATITFYGEEGAGKGLFTYSGSTFEVHGADKVTWTKLSGTAEKFSYIVEQENQNVQTGVKKGLVVAEINPSTGELVDDVKIYNFLGTQANFAINVAGFQERIASVANGNILALGIRNTIIKVGRDLTEIFETIEDVLYDGDGTNTALRNVNENSAYVMVIKKGDISTGKEKLEVSSGSDVEAKEYTVIDGKRVEISSFKSINSNGLHKVKLLVADDDKYRPSVTVVDSDLGWKSGDIVVVVSTDYDWEQAEEKTVLSVSGSTVRFQEPFKYEHYGQIYKNVDMRAELILLTRNVKFTSVGASTDHTYNGQIKFHHGFDIVRFEGVELENLGQGNVLGSYPVHFHMCEDVDTDENKIPYVRQNSVHHSHNRCYTIHGTSGVELFDNACYLCVGHSYFFEDGGERRNILDGNIGLGALKGTLIPTDETPAIFWVTNPDNRLRNNVAAGGIGPAYWYAFPTYPMGPSTDKDWMEPNEARFTPITEFDNNVGHSFKQMSMFFFDNKIDPTTGIASGYSNYDPREDPTYHLLHGNSPTKQVNITRITAYKGAPYCVWIRGGSIKVESASLADCAIGITLLRDTDAEQFLENTVIIGDSPNKGVPTIVNGVENSLGRSFPLGKNENNRNTLRLGNEFMKGPCYLKDVWFGNFYSNDYYKMGALGFRTDNDRKSSPRNGAESLYFSFADYADGTEGNRVYDMAPGDAFYSDEDGDKIATIKDYDCSLTLYDPCSQPTLIRPYPFYQTGNCENRDNWNMMACNETFGQIRVGNMDEDITIYRDDDYPNKKIEADATEDAAFNVITGGDYSYSFEFKNKVPSSFKARTLGITKYDYVRLGICIPPNAHFDLNVHHPDNYNNIDQWNSVSSPRELDTLAENGQDGGRYFYNATIGYLAVVLKNKKDFTEGETSDCPEYDCVVLSVEISGGNLNDVSCLDDAHNTYYLPPVQLTRVLYNRCDNNAWTSLTLAFRIRDNTKAASGGEQDAAPPPKSRKRRSASKLKSLLSRKRRSIPAYTKDLPATSSNPASDQGAGSTRPFTS